MDTFPSAVSGTRCPLSLPRWAQSVSPFTISSWVNFAKASHSFLLRAMSSFFSNFR